MLVKKHRRDLSNPEPHLQQQIDRLTALMDQMSLSMVEMDKKHGQLDNLITIVGQMRLGLSHRRDSEQNEAKK